MPLVTVYIPTRNRFDLLQRAVNSCLAQTFTDIEVIVVDDGSEPEVQARVAQLSSVDSRVKVVLHDKASGACAARNKAIALAQGEYLTGLDDDDEFTPERISQLLDAYNKHPEASFISSGYRIKAASGQVLTSNNGPRQITLNDLLFANIVGNQVMTRTHNLRAIDGFDVNLPSCQDYDTWIRLVAKFGTGQRCADVSYIVHQDHGSERISNHVRRRLGYEYLYSKHQHLMNEEQKASQKFYQMLYTEKPGLLALLKSAPRSQLLVALKVYLLRKIGYDI
jgi:glycosyltransferase involved in cell wall biosynthesis